MRPACAHTCARLPHGPSALQPELPMHVTLHGVPEPSILSPECQQHPNTCQSEAREPPFRGAWYDRGPPERGVRSPTNSWLYVPLLLGALGMLTDRALALWRTEARASPQWEEARRVLAVSAPVPVATLTEALMAAASHRNEDLPQAALEEAATLPSSTLVRQRSRPGSASHVVRRLGVCERA